MSYAFRRRTSCVGSSCVRRLPSQERSRSPISSSYDRSPRPMYAIVKTGGKQYRVAEGDVIEVEKLAGAPGDAVTLPAVLLVDGDDLVTDAAVLAQVAVTGEVVAQTK